MQNNYQFQIRPATYDDIPEIIKITREAFIKYGELAECDCNKLEALRETEEDVRRDIDSKIVLVAVQDGVTLGSVRVEVLEDNTAYLSRFGVLPNNQNNGIGKNIINLVDRIMKTRGIKQISLHTGSKITSLIRFYYGRGFYIKSTDTERGYLRALLVKEYE